MRSLSLLLLLLISLGLFSQPGDPSFISRLMLEPTIHARWEPSIGHAHTRSGTPSAPLYHLTDTIVVRITGDVKLDGNCSSSTPLYGFQRREGDVWVDYLPPCNVQLCCGMPSASWYQQTVAMVPAHVAQPGRLRPWKPGEYRVVLLERGKKPVPGPPFHVVAR